MKSEQYNRFFNYARAVIADDLIKQQNPVLLDICRTKGINKIPEIDIGFFKMIVSNIENETKQLIANIEVNFHGTTYKKESGHLLRDTTVIGSENLDPYWECILTELYGYSYHGLDVSETTLLNSQKRLLALIHKELEENEPKSNFNWETQLSNFCWRSIPKPVRNLQGEHVGKFYTVEDMNNGESTLNFFNQERLFVITKEDESIFDNNFFASILAQRVDVEITNNA
ncbi:hypothetical protein F7U66_11120 [Vibrio parahaemolyticus]|nr:hypothetical protein [Vibrio parahaemolyticus]